MSAEAAVQKCVRDGGSALRCNSANVSSWECVTTVPTQGGATLYER